MPHKHKRKRGENDDHDLPPTQRALPLPVFSKQSSQQPVAQPKSKRRGKDSKSNDDAPRAFKRLMAFAQGKKTRSGLDNGDNASGRSKTQESSVHRPQIKPGEDMRSFAARVDAELPISGLSTKTKVKDGKDTLGIKVQRTRKERKMHKLYDQWRAEEQKIQERREEERELAAEREMDQYGSAMFSEGMQGDLLEPQSSKKSRKRRGGAQEEDPWKELIRKRGESKIGLHDVAQAPPDLLHKKTRQRLLVCDATVDVDNIPKTAGSLRRREELQAARDDVVEAYRKIREHEQAKLDAQKRTKK